MIDTASHRSCICNWDNCQEIQQKLQQHLPARHAWNKARIRCVLAKVNASRHNKTNPLSFRAVVFKHLNIPEDKQLKYRAGFRIACYHFEIPLLQKFTRYRSTFLTRQDVLKLKNDPTLPSSGYSDTSNTVSELMRASSESLNDAEEERRSNKYAQVPVGNA